MARTRTIKVAAAQLPGLPLAKANQSLEHVEKAIRDAASGGIQLLVLPECAYPAYVLHSAETYRAANPLSSETFVERLRGWASDAGICLVCGFVEQCGDALYNAAVVIDADGRECGRHRKLFLWGDDNAYFQPGHSLEPIDTPIGRIGVVICADGRAPEIASGLANRGAQLIAVPTCWVNVAKQPGEYRNAQAEFMIEGRARECGIPIIAANKFGHETDDIAYCGWSVIYDGSGKMLAQAPPDKPAIIDARISLAEPAPIEIPGWAQRRILRDDPPVAPDIDGLDTVKIAVVPQRLVTTMSDDDEGCDLFQHLAANGVQIVGTSLPDEDGAERVEVYGRALGMTVVGFPFVERLMIERFGAFGCVAAEHMLSFVPTRVMALDGASLVFVAGDDIPKSVLRTRAAENRVFIAAASKDKAILIDPTGTVLAESTPTDDRPIVTKINLREAADKQVFQDTNIWQQRKPNIYATAFEITKPKLRP